MAHRKLSRFSFRGSSGFARRAVVLAGIAVVGVIVVALPAWAHHPILSGETVCSDGAHVVTWTDHEQRKQPVPPHDDRERHRQGRHDAVCGHGLHLAGSALRQHHCCLQHPRFGQRDGRADGRRVVARRRYCDAHDVGVLASQLPRHDDHVDGVEHVDDDKHVHDSTTVAPTTTTSIAAETSTTQAPTTTTTVAPTTTTTVAPTTTTSIAAETSTTQAPTTTTTLAPTTTTTIGELGSTTTSIAAETSTTQPPTTTTTIGELGSTTTSIAAETSSTQPSTTTTTVGPLGSTSTSAPSSATTVKSASSTSGGSLPFTGGSGAAPLLGLGSLAVGGALWLVARRRHGMHS